MQKKPLKRGFIIKMDKQKKRLLHENGKMYFTRGTERRFFFGLTIIMLLLGIFVKAGLF